jgi:outer membrane lipoprotein
VNLKAKDSLSGEFHKAGGSSPHWRKHLDSDKIVNDMKNKYLHSVLLPLLFFLLPGCVYVISKDVRRQVSRDLSLKEVIKNPDVYTGRIVLWGGVIIESKNLKQGTQVVILQKDLNSWGRPKESDESQGRFIVFQPGYLDTAIYRKDRKITVAGEVIGKKVLPIDEIEYTYPLLSPREIHLWEEERKTEYPYWHDPWWYYPYPYWPYPYRHPYRPWYWYY